MTAPILVQARSYWREVLIGILVLVLLVGSVATCQYRKRGVTPEHQAMIDSLRITQPAHDSTLLRSRQDETVHLQAAADLEAAVARISAVAAVQRRNADQLAALARSAGTDAVKWRDAYIARTAEADSLRAAVDSATARANRERLARIEADRRATLDSARNVALQKLALGLERDANNAANCRIARVISCATRTQTFVLGGVLGAAGAIAVLRR